MPYTTFRAQVEAGQRRGHHVQGRRDPGRLQDGGDYPPGKGRPPTQLPDQPPGASPTTGCSTSCSRRTWWSTPSRSTRAVAAGRRCSSASARRSCSSLLFVLLMRRAAGGAGGRRWAASAARGPSATSDSDAAHDLRGRRRHRRGRGRAGRDRRLPARPGQVRAARRRDPQGRAARPARPGTGKTLLARAVAGEADVPFFSISASEFIEMIVGVGASRVRDLFEQAKAGGAGDHLHRRARRHRPGARRRPSLGGNDEREQTLNQILTEMDGFTGSEGVIVLAATNRPEILDPALLRPGRFDRRVVVNPPDQRGPRADPRGPHAHGAAGRRRRPRRRRLVDAGHGRRRPARTWSTRRRSPPPGGARDR